MDVSSEAKPRYATVKLRIPAPSSMLIVNLLGTFGLLGFAVALGGLTHNAWWVLAAASVEAVVLCIVATMHIASEKESDEESAEAADDGQLATVRPRAV